MPIAKTAAFAVRPESLVRCEEVIREFVGGVAREEPGTRVYVSLREERDPTRFVHVMVFDDEAAEAAHRDAERTRRFTEALYPHTLEGVAFTDCSLVAPK
ncbi:MAG: (4S)-4-hydroxy-5-phosphonooxypentane-2,3-dione isomerase [Solirubrobacteraceae bacterium]|nr:(4S)-4-hydroxy-5-phosphonooxypentane-2,3-dione isomerase [Solirubrobacteraceae bacterium]MDX6675616.1 (4S)-4-hydroxy-5-phosphonooxypentane-2,3-dione isomerase [Solirubrobacteraceae bacterium]